MTLAKRMKKQMSELGLTQEAVANRADISQGMVYKLLSGKAKSTSKIVQLAHALECDIEWLATGEVPPTPNKVSESSPGYRDPRGSTIAELRRQIKTLPKKEQKSLAMEIMNDLLDN